MRWFCAAVMAAVLFWPVRPSPAQDAPHPDQLKKMFDDAMDQLKAAQQRKNELAAENDQLKAKLADLQKKLDAATEQANELQREAAGYAEKTFYLRSHYVAWQEFLRRYPHLLSRWKVFLDNDQLTMPNDIPAFMDSDWPMSSATPGMQPK
jgi:chromosome segregation ATPase